MARSELMKRIAKNSTIEEAAVLKHSRFFNEKDIITTPVPMFNVALSGEIDGGYTPCLTLIAGASKNFKTMYSLFMSKAYLDKYEDAVLIFYDNEFGSPQAYFESMGIDLERVWHVPIANIEQLKFDMTKQLNQLNRGDHVIIVIDSIGNIASIKEIEDALKEKGTADMTRAKQLKSCFRIVTPLLSIKDIPMVVVNHTYKSQDMYPVDIVSGGTGSYYSSSNIFIVGKRQEKGTGKDADKVIASNFQITIEKSRFVKEKMKIPISVGKRTGLNIYSGLLDEALESGHVVKPKIGYYSRVNMETGEVEEQQLKAAQTNTAEFWVNILADQKFKNFIIDKYKVSENQIINDSGENLVDMYDTDEEEMDE